MPLGLDAAEPHFLTAQDSTGEFGYSITCPTVVPEPSVAAILLAGVALAGARRARRRCA